MNLNHFDLAAIFYDTKCCFCSTIIKYISDKAYKKGVEFFDIEELRTNRYTNSPSFDLTSLDSILFTDAKTVSIYSDAVIRLLIYLGGVYKFFGYMLKAIPKVIRDKLYRFIAKHRYEIFGIRRCHTK